MNKKVKNFLSINNEDNLMIVLAFMSFSIGLWTNYRQLWLQGIGYGVGEISRILSVALICSAVISFIISIFSTKVNIKSTIQLLDLKKVKNFNQNTHIQKLSTFVCAYHNNHNKKLVFKIKLPIDQYSGFKGTIIAAII